ncbi:MAG TPA: DNA ligase [Gallionella sp.]|jgi:DNA ligase-1|nr:DNA ligase [Gallionella sp.]
MRKFLASCLLALVFTSSAAPLFATEFASPPLMLANVYHDGIPLADYWVSEKLDGVRAYWDGAKLLTRGGERIIAPPWFTAGWPTTPLDGELWVARGQFSQAVSIVRQQTPDDAMWRRLHFMAFDLPAHPGTFDERNAALQQVVAKIGQAWLQQIKQFKVADRSALQALLKRVTGQGGEGLMLHRGNSYYQAARNDDLLKLKLYQDAEAKVVAHLPGKGKYAGMIGALEVESPEGLRFRLGAGFSDAERRNPPPLGSWVTYRYNGLNEKSGIPRFARFMRVREDFRQPEKQ